MPVFSGDPKRLGNRTDYCDTNWLLCSAKRVVSIKTHAEYSPCLGMRTIPLRTKVQKKIGAGSWANLMHSIIDRLTKKTPMSSLGDW